MDKNTITGLVLIGLLFVGFSIINRPSEEQLAAQRQYQDSITAVQQQAAELKAKQEAALAHEKEAVLRDSTSLFFNALQGEDKQVVIKNNLINVSLAYKGGRVVSASLNEYKSQDRETPVVLFDEHDSRMNFNFYNRDEVIQTQNYYFTPVNVTDSCATMRLYSSEDSYIDFIYKLTNDSYLLDFQIKANNMAGKLASTDYVDIAWAIRIRQQEKGYTYENRLSELTYKISDDDTDHLSAASDDEKSLKEKADWIGFKDQFFSSVFISDQDFDKVKLTSDLEKKNSGYIKHYQAEMNTFFDPTGAQTTDMHMYLGPNHYKTLRAIDKDREEDWDLDKLVYLGWPLVRWINQFIIINIFDWLTGWGLNMGIVLLLLTVFVKAAIYPTTWKTYMSSAKMRVLRPKMEELNKKYPKQEDAMKKQQEMMMIYNQYGVSPMGGCLPMLLQFPIIISLFMFVPSAIELRQQSFLWAEDLSTYDAFINFPFTIPFLGDHLSLFCVLMTVTNLLNTFYTMQMQDNGAQPQMGAMKWMMYLMPVMFLFILNDYPAGLNYYYFLSTLISVGTTILLRKTTNEVKLLAILEAKKKSPKDIKQSSFAARLEAMQKQQEELMRQQQQRQK